MIKAINSDYIEDVIYTVKKLHGDVEINIIDENLTPEKEIKEELSNIDIFGSRRYFIIRNPKTILPFAKNIDTEDYIYLHTNKKIKDIDTIIGKTLTIENFIREEFLKYGVSIDRNVIKFIVSNIQDNRLSLKNEIKKCVFYIYPEKNINDVSQIKDILVPDTEILIWNILNYIVDNSKKDIIKEYKKLKDQNTDSIYILTMVLRQIKIILLVLSMKDNSSIKIMDELKKIKINTSVYGIDRIKRSLDSRNIEKYSKEKLTLIYHKMITLYSSSNGGKIDIDTGLLLLLLFI
ncbi:MAG: DNA polymerase III subunit delta [Patescibacteria group bacterium]